MGLALEKLWPIVLCRNGEDIGIVNAWSGTHVGDKQIKRRRATEEYQRKSRSSYQVKFAARLTQRENI